METFIKIIINISLILGSGYSRQRVLLDVEETTSNRIKKGFSSSEGFARKLTSGLRDKGL